LLQLFPQVLDNGFPVGGVLAPLVFIQADHIAAVVDEELL